MALGTTLRYYRGQFNPAASYQGNWGDENVISMYNPEELSKFVEATEKRQGRFDAVKSTIAAERARIGELDSYNVPELRKQLTNFENRINTVVKDKYNGDYSAAANEIAEMIGTERTNPFYHYNKQQVLATNRMLAAKDQLGVNFIEVTNPLETSFEDWQNGMSVEPAWVNREDIVKASAAVFQNFAKQLRSDSGLQLSPEGQYFTRVLGFGFSNPDEAIDFMNKSGLGQQIYDSMPGLANVKDQRVVWDALAQGAMAGIGQSDVNMVQNQGYLNALEQAREAGLRGGLSGEKLIESGFEKIMPQIDRVMTDPNNSKAINDIVLDKAQREGLNVSSLSGLESAYNSIKGTGKYPFVMNNAMWGQSTKSILKDWGIDSDSPSFDRARQIVNTIKEVRDRVQKDFIRDKFEAAKLYRVNDLYGTTTEESNEIVRNKKDINSFVSGLQSSDLQGTSRDEQDKLESIDRSQIEVTGFIPIATGNRNSPFIYQLNILAPEKTAKSGTKAKTKEISVQFTPGTFDDQITFSSYLARLSGQWSNTFIKELWKYPDLATRAGLPKPTEKVIK